MDQRKAPRVLDDDGPGAPPRKNGELVFGDVWEGRLFGLTMALHESGAFGWDEFRDRLIAEIASWERDHPDGEGYRYYDRWLAAFERLVADKGFCATDDLAHRLQTLASRPPGHDH